MDRFSNAASGSGNGATSDTARAALTHILWRQRKFVFIPVAASLLIAIVYLITEPRRYAATARLTVSAAGSRAGDESVDNPQISNFLNTENEKLLSHAVLALALTEKVPADAGSAIAGKQIKELRTFREGEGGALATMRNFAESSVGHRNDALSLSFETPFKEEAAIIANAIVRAFEKYQSQPKQSNVTSVLSALYSKKTDLDAELARTTAQMQQLEQKYGDLSNNGQNILALKQLEIVAKQREAAHVECARAKADSEEAGKLVQRDPRVLVPNNNDNAIASADDELLLRANLEQLQTKLKDLRDHYLPDHPAVRAMKQKYDAAASTYAEAVRRRYLRAQVAEDDLNVQFKAQEDRAREASGKIGEYSRLRDDSDRIHRQLEALDSRIHGVEATQASAAIVIDFFDPADASSRSTKVSHPSPFQTIGLMLLIGLTLGCALALTRDFVDDRLRSADEIKASLRIPTLGTIPRIASLEPSMAGQHSVLDATGEVAEAFRLIRGNIASSAPKDRSKTLLVTSPNVTDGKTIAAANLASITAQSGKKVLLIDANLRDPGLHTVFEVKETRVGLTTLLNGHGTWEQAIQPSPVSGLDLLPAGPRSRTPADLLNSPMFSELLEMLAERYDQIIVDAPPVMGSNDARIIAANCDVTLLVLRAAKSTRKVAMLARTGLIGVGAHLLGVVVNDVPREHEEAFDGGFSSADQNAAEPHKPSPRTEVLARRAQ